MRRLKDHTKFQVGRIYNSIYVGDNAAYARINGKRTVLITQIEPQLKYVVLFDRFGSPYSKDIRSGEITSNHPAHAFKDCELYEPENEGEWFVKSVKVCSLNEGIERDLIKPDAISGERLNSSTITCMWGPSGGIFGYCADFDVENKTGHPYLQTVFVFWKTRDEMCADLAKHGVKYE